MKTLFSETGLQLLESLSFADTLYAFDFDGTLAPIVDEPGEAKARATTESLLTQLSQLAPVALISGRSIHDLQSRIKNPIPYLIGNHGIEGFGTKLATTEKAREICRTWAQQLTKELQHSLKELGITLEDKTFSLALHYRKSRNKKKARTELFHVIQRLAPAPRIILGKCVINLISAGGPHKGIALLELINHLNLKCAFYIGDDDTDEDVFSLPVPHIISTRVGRKAKSHAQFFIEQQKDIDRVLRTLIHNQIQKSKYR